MLRTLCTAVLACVVAVSCCAALPLIQYSYNESFEGEEPPIRLWAKNGDDPIINFIGITDEKAFSGTHSLKLDITFTNSPYYYFSVPMRVPVSGTLTMSGRMLLGEENTAHCGFGPNFMFPPTTHSGLRAIESYNQPDGEWKLLEMDLVETGMSSAQGVMGRYVHGVSAEHVGIILDRWALFLRGTPGARAVVYLDDVIIEGEVPDEGRYLAQVQENFDARQQDFVEELQELQQELEQLQRVVRAQIGDYAELAPALVRAVTNSSERAEELLEKFIRTKYASPDDMSAMRHEMSVLRSWPTAVTALEAARDTGRRFLLAPRNRPIPIPRRGEATISSAITEEDTLHLSAAPGEYQPVSTVIYGVQEVRDLQVSCTDLQGPAGIIPASAVDIKLLQYWFQGASNNIGYTPNKWLIAELLLNDDDLVRVDIENETNYLRSTAEDGTEEYLVCSDPDSSNLENVRPIDADELLPFTVNAGESREVWITVHVPEDAAAGTYEGTVNFNSPDGNGSLPLQVTVHPFTLEPSRLTYSIYYRGRLSEDGLPTIGSERKSEEQFRIELADMQAHGVLYPTNYQGRGNEELLRRTLEIRQELGLPTDRFYNLGYMVGPQGPDQLEAMVKTVQEWMDLLREYGYEDIYFYGIDEAKGERLLSQKAAWAAVKEIGAKTFVACYHGTFEAMGDLLDLAVHAFTPDPEEAAKWHSVGSEIFCYANPQVGVEDPYVYRRNFGLVLWQENYDGAMNYAYQHGFGHIWNDFDSNRYRDHNFTYPTINGIVGTIAWEGFREAVDDVRYMTTLEKLIAEAPADKQAVAAEAQAWINGIDAKKDDLDDLRAAMVEWIVKLQ